jgi:Zn-dependent protease with chaperone function
MYMASVDSYSDTSPARAGERFAGRPLEYSSSLAWLMSGGARNWRGLLVGLLLGWGALPLALIGAITGCISGAAVGLGSSWSLTERIEDLPVLGVFVTWAWSALGGVLGALAGFVLGAVAGAVYGFVLLPLLIVTVAYAAGGILQVLMVVSFSVLVVIAIAAGYTVLMISAEGPRNGLAGYRRMSRREAEVLVPLVHDCADRLGFRNAPRILVDDSDEPGAYAFSRHIVLTRGLLDLIEGDETALAGVVCHELVHWHNADPVSSLAVRGMALPAYLLYNLMGRSSQFVLVALSFPLRLSMRYAFLPAQAQASRDAEYRADQGAPRAGLAGGLKTALERFRELETGRTGWDDAICATHPPTELRIERLDPYLIRTVEPVPGEPAPPDDDPEDLILLPREVSDESSAR